MTIQEAARLLSVDPALAPDKLEGRFLELRRRLEDQIAKAPTPGLQAKYRASLADVTEAFETLVLAANSNDLPMLRPAELSPSSIETTPNVVAAIPPAKTGKRPSQRREMILMATLAVLLFVVGGWWIVKTRAEAKEKARIEAEEKAAKEEEKARLVSLATELRSRVAAGHAKWDTLMHELQKATQRLSELKNDAHSTRDLPAGQVARLNAELTGQKAYCAWLDPYLEEHKLKVSLAKLDSLLSAGAIEEAEKEASELEPALESAAEEIKGKRNTLTAVTGLVQLKIEDGDTKWSLEDAFGENHQGAGAADGVEAGIGSAVLTLRRAKFPAYRQNVEIRSGSIVTPDVNFPTAKVKVDSLPQGLQFYLTDSFGNKHSGRTPSTLTVVPGVSEVRVSRPDFEDVVRSVSAAAGGTGEVKVPMVAQSVRVQVAESDVAIEFGKVEQGRGRALIANLSPGSYPLALSRGGSQTYRTIVQVKQEEGEQLLNFSWEALLEKNITCTHCGGSGKLVSRETCSSCDGRGSFKCNRCDGTGKTLNGVLTGLDSPPYGQGRTFYDKCEQCNGRGKITCDDCRGSGRIRNEETCDVCDGVGRLSQMQLSH